MAGEIPCIVGVADAAVRCHLRIGTKRPRHIHAAVDNSGRDDSVGSPLGTARQSQTVQIGNLKVNLDTIPVGPDYCRTMILTLLRGRDISAIDLEASPRPVIVNDALARKFWPGEDPIGQMLKYVDDQRGPGLSIVGVVKTGKYHTLNEEPQPVV